MSHPADKKSSLKGGGEGQVIRFRIFTPRVCQCQCQSKIFNLARVVELLYEVYGTAEVRDFKFCIRFDHVKY